MKKLNLNNHSTADWDFLVASNWEPWDDWGLYALDYVSPPSCLVIGGFSYDTGLVLTKHPSAQNLKQGRIVTWYKNIDYNVANARFVCGVTGPGQPFIAKLVYYGGPDWYKSRMTWWQTTNPHNEPATLVQIHHFINDEWVFASESYEPPLSDPLNRCGICSPRGYWWCSNAFDDTEIWVPVE